MHSVVVVGLFMVCEMEFISDFDFADVLSLSVVFSICCCIRMWFGELSYCCCNIFESW